MPPSRNVRMNQISFGLLVAALLSFWAFQFLPWYHGADQHIKGWRMWSGSFREIVRLRMDEELVAAMAFVTSGLMIFAGPFIMPLLHGSRWFWWLMTIMSASALVSLNGVIAISLLWNRHLPGPGMLCLVSAQILFLTGLLFIRREPVAELP